MLAALLERLGFGRQGLLGKVLGRGGAIAPEQLMAVLGVQRATGGRRGQPPSAGPRAGRA